MSLINRTLRLAAPLVVVAAALAAPPAAATITVVNTLVAEPPAAFDKGIDFPLLGLHDSTPTFIAARVYKWTQQGVDMYVLEPTEDFTVYPQLLRMGSDSRKSLMIKATHPLPPGNERDYRIVLKEFDRADGTNAPAAENVAGMAVDTKPQVSIPMIVRGPSGLVPAPMEVVGLRAAPAPAANHERAPGAPGSLLTLYNPGKSYQRIVAISVNEPIGPGNQRLGYVLSGQQVDVGMSAVKPGDRITVQYVNGPDAKVDWSSNSDDRKSVEFVAK